MSGDENHHPSSEITFLVEDIEAILEMNRILEEENHQLKQEISRLKTQITNLQSHEHERKSILWKKIQLYNSPTDTIHQFTKDNNTTTTATAQQLHNKKKQSSTTPITTATTINTNDVDRDPTLMMDGLKKSSPDQRRPMVGPAVGSVPPPPPPPPPPPSGSLIGSRKVRRVPEVIQFYRLLTKRNAQLFENRGNLMTMFGDVNPKNMIGEIEDRSTYLTAIKSDVETHGELIQHLTEEVENAAFTDISAADSFVKWLDGKLSCLVDERAVLKHFPRWPERKADALREAACTYRDLNLLKFEISESIRDASLKQGTGQVLGKIQALQDRLERSISNIERTREGMSKKYRELRIPWDWMFDSGLVGMIKLNSLKLAREYMQKTINELYNPRCSKPEELILQGVRFAYRAHQFAGGFDQDTMKVFEELKQLYSTKFSETQ